MAHGQWPNDKIDIIILENIKPLASYKHQILPTCFVGLWKLATVSHLLINLDSSSGMMFCWNDLMHRDRDNWLKSQQLYCQTQKTATEWKFSWMLIVYWPNTIKFRICKQTSKPQTNYRCCLRFSYLMPYWFISRNTITFHKYFWCSRFCVFHNKNLK